MTHDRCVFNNGQSDISVYGITNDSTTLLCVELDDDYDDLFNTGTVKLQLANGE